MESRLSLQAQTNSDDITPEYALFNPIELDHLIEKAKAILDWGDTSIKYIAIVQDVECDFIDGDGDVNNDRYPQWSPSVLHVNQYGVNIVFEHHDSGHEMFFEYAPKHKAALHVKADCPNCEDYLEFESAPGMFIRNKYLCRNCGCELSIPKYQSLQRKQLTEKQ